MSTVTVVLAYFTVSQAPEDCNVLTQVLVPFLPPGHRIGIVSILNLTFTSVFLIMRSCCYVHAPEG